MKRCPKCNLTKDDVDFYREAKRPDGLSGWCKCCVRVRNKARYLGHPCRTTEIVKPRRIAIKERHQQERIVKYGRAVAEIMEDMEGVDGF